MPSASASDAPAGGLTLPAIIPVLAVTAALSVAGKALLMEQPLGPRVMLLAIVAGAGSMLASLPLTLLMGWLARGQSARLRGALGALWMLTAFIPATLFAFAVENRLIEGHIEADSVTDLGARELFWTLFGAMGMFTPTGLPYLLPWPVLMVALVAFLCFYRWHPSHDV